MEMQELLMKKLHQHFTLEDCQVNYYEQKTNLSEAALFGALAFKGTLIEKDPENGIFVSEYKQGFFHPMKAKIAAAIKDETLYLCVQADSQEAEAKVTARLLEQSSAFNKKSV